MFSPIKPLLSTHQNNRDHRKIAVIDGCGSCGHSYTESIAKLPGGTGQGSDGQGSTGQSSSSSSSRSGSYSGGGFSGGSSRSSGGSYSGGGSRSGGGRR